MALAFAARRPSRVEALGLVDTTAWYGPDAERTWEERAQRALAEGMDALIPFQLTRWFSDAFRQSHGDVAAHLADVFTNNDPRCYAAACRMLGSFDLRSALGPITAPTAVIVGSEDYATPVAMAAELNAGITGSTLHVLPDTRHLSPLEHPDEIAGLLQALLARATGPPKLNGRPLRGHLQALRPLYSDKSAPARGRKSATLHRHLFWPAAAQSRITARRRPA